MNIYIIDGKVKVKVMDRLLFIYNPHSGKGMINNYITDIVDKFVKNGYRVELYPTQKKLDAKEKIIRWAEDFDMVVCSGGDGTLNEVISGLMETDERIMLGYIPAGSTNDFATSVMLPKNMLEAADIVMKGMPLSVDIGSFNKRNFVYIAAFGAFTDVSYMTPQEMKNVLGHQAYIIEAFSKLTSLRSYRMRFKTKEMDVEDEFLYGMISNSVSVGGFKGITGKGVILNDGLFEVTLVKKPQKVIDMQLIFGALLGLDVKCDKVITFKADKILIEAEEKVPWVLDGEYGGSPRKITIRNHKKAIDIKTGISKI